MRLSRLLSLLALVACRRDTTITHGADGAPEWDRRLAAAVAVGITGDSAKVILTSNGFTCDRGEGDFVCDKYSGGRIEIVRRRWIAIVTLDTQRRVSRIRASTGLIGP